MRVSVQEADFDVGAETEALAAGRADVGAVASFVGYVRADKLAGESAAEQAVSAMTLEHYPGMTEKSLEAIESNGAWLVAHRGVAHLDARRLAAQVDAHRRVVAQFVGTLGPP